MKSLLLASLLACNNSNTGYLTTSQGIRVVTDSSFETETCVYYDSMVQETEMALEAVLYALYNLGLDDRSAFVDFRDYPIYLCFTPWAVDMPKSDFVAGLTDGWTYIYVALGRHKPDLTIKQTSLTHELLHVALARMCLLEGCDINPTHNELIYWRDTLNLANYLWGEDEIYKNY